MKFLMRISGVFALAALLPVSARADAVLNEPTQPALEAALAAGGRITVNCDGTLLISNTVNVTTDAYLDATGHRLTIANLSATNAARLFTVNTGASFALINFTLTGGRTNTGGAIYNNRGFLTLENCVLSNNLAIGASGGNGGNGGDHSFRDGGKGGNGGNGRSAFGGAIYNLHGTALVNRCSFLTNAATAGDGGNGGTGGDGFGRGGNGGNGGNGSKAQGGAIFNSGLLIISNSTFMRNGATGGSGGTGGTNGTGLVQGDRGHGGSGGSAVGGAICTTNRGRTYVYGSTFALNGVLAGDSANAGTEILHPRTGKQGGHSYGGAVVNYGTNSFLNCTFFGNRSTAGAGGSGSATDIRGGRGGDGGHAYGGSLFSSKFVGVTNCTFFDGGTAGGAAGQGGQSAVAGKNGKNGARRGGNISMGGGSFILKNALIAFAATPGTNGYGTFKDAGYNLSSDRSIKLKGPGSMTNVDPLIGILGRNGGFTETVPLFTGSPAINAGDTNCTNFCLPLDQRGVPRPYDGRSDIGAYEFGLTLLPPTITSQPQPQTAQVGATVTFIVVAQGDPPLSYQWRRGGTNITGAEGPVLTLSNVQTNDAANYSVVIANNSGSATSSGALLTLLDRVVITQQPASTSVFPGSNATFTVSATGVAPLFYQWYFNGMLIPGATQPTFRIVAAQETNAGDYQVIVFNSFSSVTSVVATLTVGMAVPEITVQPADQTVDAGTDATLMVSASGSQPLSFQWYRNDTNLLSGRTNATLTISNVQAVHAGNYTVIVTNFLGSATSAVAVLTVRAVAPRFITQPISQTPCFGNSVSLRVEARGTEPIYYQWLQEDVPLPNETNATLTISSVQTNHGGKYTVIASNEVGTATSEPAELTVTDAPNITQQPLDQVKEEGSDAVFAVQHCPFPDLFTYQWYFNDVEIAGATNATLTVTNVDFDDAGLYVVIIKNPFGETRSEPAELSVTVAFTKECVGEADVTCTLTVEVTAADVEYTLDVYNYESMQWEFVESKTGTGGPLMFVDEPRPATPAPRYRIIPLFP